ncbi:MAG: helix-turn-helix domain-containing protein [Nocardioides sp.]|uniref:helix-turn-helix domain-containing protein n=1 Tax=Nocardioides sp. TaxID=35761 RepID=UPI003F07CFD9
MADQTNQHSAVSLPGQSVSNWASLGRLIQGARKERGMTQAGLALEAGVSRAWLAKVESGHRGAEFERILRVLNALEFDLVARPRRRSVADLDLAEALAARRRRPGSADGRHEEDW